MNAIGKNFHAGLLGMLPSEESYHDFTQHAENAHHAIQKLIHDAYSLGLIQEEHEQALLNVIKEYACEEESESDLDGSTFQDIVMEVTKRSALDTPLTVNTWIETCLNPLARELFETEIKQSMITRLQQAFQIRTPKQQTVLRVVAFWIAANRPHLHWDYQKFVTLSENTSVKRSLSKMDEGVTIALSIQGRSGLVEQKTIYWLRTELFNCLEFLNLPNEYVRKDKVTSLSATAVSLTIPKQPGPRYEPEFYTQAIQASIVIAHQMAIRWLLSAPSTQQGMLVIAIYAGGFSDAISALQAIFDEQFRGAPPILLNNLAYQCARVADVKVGFRKPPDNIVLRKNEYLTVWTIDYFWFYPYFNMLLQLPELLLNDKHVELIERYFQYKTTALHAPPSIIGVIQKSSHNPLMLIEIAKSLLSRKKYFLADKVLSDILVLYPRHIIGRVARMIVYEKMALQQCFDLATTEFAFERAIAEGKLILPDCDDPVVWCEMGLVYYAWALQYFRYGEQCNEKEKERLKHKILTALTRSSEQFLKGISLSSDGKDIRSLAFFIRTQALLERVSRTHDFPEGVFSDENSCLYSDTMIRVVKLIGLLPADFSHENLVEKLAGDTQQRHVYIRFLMRLLAMNRKYQGSILFKSSTPNSYYFFGCFLWDFLPVLTQELCCLIYRLFQQAKHLAETLREKGSTISVNANGYPQDPQVFIALVDESLQRMERAVPQEILRAKTLWERGDLQEGGKISEKNMRFLTQDAMEKVSKVKLTLLEIEFR